MKKIDYSAVEAALQENLAAPSQYPEVDRAMNAGIAEDNDNLVKLEIESPEEFGTKFKGQLDIMAEEHDLGDLLGYSLTDYGIIIYGSDNMLKLDYSMENPDVKPVYYFEQGAAEPLPEAMELEEAPEEVPEEILEMPEQAGE